MMRPTGVTILAVLQLIFNLLGLLGGLGFLLLGDRVASSIQEQGQNIPSGAVPALAWVLIIFSLIGLVIAWGLFTLKSWAWLATLIFQALGILNNVASLVQGANPGGAVFGIVISGVIIYYLLRPEVKQAFGK